MEIGIVGKQSVIVTEELTAKNMGSGELNVFATPAMIALIEKTAWMSVADKLDEGCGTVGTLISVKHLAATPPGCEVSCETKLIEIDRKRLVFEARVYDEAGDVGLGTHERFIVNNEKFLEKTKEKHT